jgi:uncharacterized membrane protein HdeD (DUF308 family)
MNTSVTVSDETRQLARGLAAFWWLIGVLGAILVVIGVVLIADVVGAAFTLALLIGFGLIVSGIDEIVQADRHVVRWPSYVLGAGWILTGVIAVAWPDVTLWVLAVVIGVGLIATGLMEIGFAVKFRKAIPGWQWAMVTGGLALVAGLISIIWPGATVLVLAVLLGIYVLLRGLALLAFAFTLRKLAKSAGL